MGRPQPPPPANILTSCLTTPFTWCRWSRYNTHTTRITHRLAKHTKGKVGLDHILAAWEYIHPTCSSGIDHEISSSYLKSDHRLVYVSFVLFCPNIAPTSPTTKQFHYQRVAQIPLVKTYTTNSSDNSIPWFTPKTLGILPTDVHVNA